MRVLIPLVALGISSTLAATVLESGPAEVPLLELYTSEGCSSCPAAEAWLNARRNDPGLWKTFVPVAFHVDYWDNLGWPDRFASPAFTQRQRRYQEADSLSTVYTPAFLRGGREWHPGEPARPANTPGILRVEIIDNEARATFQPTATPESPLSFHLTALAFDQTTKVRNGENVGRILTHDFIARGVRSAELRESADGTFTTSIPLPENAAAIAAWVEAGDSVKPIQAVGGYLPPPD